MQAQEINIFRNFRKECGSSLVEFALIALFFFMVIFGIIEFGLLLYNQQVVTNAGREGARFGVVARPNGMEVQKAEIEAVVRDYAEEHVVSFGDKNFKPTATFSTGLTYCEKFQDVLTVDVEYDYSFLFLPFASTTLGTRAEMYCE